jgi:hypothetical protein
MNGFHRIYSVPGLAAAVILAVSSIEAISATPSAPRPLALPAGAEGLAEAPMLLSINVAANRNGPEAESLRKLSAAHPIVVTWWVKDLDGLLGMPVDTIERVTAVRSNLGEYAGVLTCREPLDRDKLLSRFAPGATGQPLRGKSFFAAENAENGVCPVDERTFILGSRGGVQYVLDCWKSSLGQPARPAAEQDAGFWFAQFKPTAAYRNAAKAAGSALEPYAPLLEAKVFRMTATVRKGLRVDIQGEFASEEAAGHALPAFKKMLQSLDRYFALAERNMPTFLDEQQEKYPGAGDVARAMRVAIQGVREGIHNAVYEQQGNFIAGTISIRTSKPVTTVVLLMSLAPRPKKKP